jgi:hypothetical protein
MLKNIKKPTLIKRVFVLALLCIAVTLPSTAKAYSNNAAEAAKPGWTATRVVLTWDIKTLRQGKTRPAKPQTIPGYQEVVKYSDSSIFVAEDGARSEIAGCDDKDLPGCRLFTFPGKGRITVTQDFVVRFPKNSIGNNIAARLSPENFQALLGIYQEVISHGLTYRHLKTADNVTTSSVMISRGFADCGGLTKIVYEKAAAAGLEVMPISGFNLSKNGTPEYHVVLLVRGTDGNWFVVDPARLHQGFKGQGFNGTYALIANNPVMGNFFTEKKSPVVDGATVTHTQLPPTWGYSKMEGSVSFEALN